MSTNVKHRSTSSFTAVSPSRVERWAELAAHPVVELETSLVAHWELSVRLRDGGAPLLPAKRFPPSAARARLAEQVDRWVLIRAAEHLAASTTRRALEVAVSSESLRDPTFLEFVTVLCAEHALDPSRMILDVPTLDDEDLSCAAELRDLRDAGFRLALGTFGPGAAPLEQLRRFPFDFVKLDAGLVHRLGRRARDGEPLARAAATAREFAAQPVACLVPDEEAVGIVRECDIALAGFGLGRPRRLEELI